MSRRRLSRQSCGVEVTPLDALTAYDRTTGRAGCKPLRCPIIREPAYIAEAVRKAHSPLFRLSSCGVRSHSTGL